MELYLDLKFGENGQFCLWCHQLLLHSSVQFTQYMFSCMIKSLHASICLMSVKHGYTTSVGTFERRGLYIIGYNIDF